MHDEEDARTHARTFEGQDDDEDHESDDEHEEDGGGGRGQVASAGVLVPVAHGLAGDDLWVFVFFVFVEGRGGVEGMGCKEAVERVEEVKGENVTGQTDVIDQNDKDKKCYEKNAVPRAVIAV